LHLIRHWTSHQVYNTFETSGVNIWFLFIIIFFKCYCTNL
jgi:hypothetical protein